MLLAVEIFEGREIVTDLLGGHPRFELQHVDDLQFEDVEAEFGDVFSQLHVQRAG